MVAQGERDAVPTLTVDRALDHRHDALRPALVVTHREAPTVARGRKHDGDLLAEVRRGACPVVNRLEDPCGAVADAPRQVRSEEIAKRSILPRELRVV